MAATYPEVKTMINAVKVLCVVTVAIPVAAYGSQPHLKRMTSVDPSGCMLEHIAVEEGIRQFQFDSLSPDGGRLAVGWERGEGNRGTYILDLTLGERTDIPGFNNGAVFAPDGLTLVNSIYTDDGKTDIVEYNLQTGEITEIAPHPDWDWLASYSSDGDTILFNSYRTGASDIYTYTKASGKLKQWTDNAKYEAHGQFSPDDSKILFHRQEEGGDFNIFAIDTKTGKTSQLTHAPTEESYASWSPDGKTIAFTSDRHKKPGTGDIFLMDLNGENVRQLTDYDAKDGYPFFSPDGKHLYFNSSREPEGVYRIALDEQLNCLKEM
jgi:Tol biopolymer transport system component